MVEFAWDWIDEATAECALERLPASSPSEKPSWLGRCCWEWMRGGRGGIRAPAESYFAEWADEEGFHSPWRMCDELGRRFVGVRRARCHSGGDHQRNRVPLRGHQASVGRTLGHGPGEDTHALIHKVRRR